MPCYILLVCQSPHECPPAAVVGATFMAPVVAMVNSADVDHTDEGRDQSGPYDVVHSHQD